MGLVYRLHAARSPDQRPAIYRATVFPVPGVHEMAGRAGGDQLRHRLRVFRRLDCGERRSLYSSCLSISEQQRLHSCAQRRQLFLGHAKHDRLWNELSDQLLQHRHAALFKRDSRSSVHGLQRHVGGVGEWAHHEATMRTDLAADFLEGKRSLQLGEAAALPAARDLE